MLGFGAQTDTRIIRPGHDLPGTGQALNGPAVANYIAKYATKTLTPPRPALPAATRRDRPRPAALLRALPADDHHRLATRGRPPWLPLPGLGACSATAATSSPNPAATPSPSASSAPPAPTTAAPPAPRTTTATPGAAT